MSTTQRFLIISGLSGAGKTVALHALEDAGFYCVDNLPVGILPQFASYLAEQESPHFARVAIGVDARSQADALAALPASLDALAAQGVEAELLFMDASDATVVKRYSETRRRHPLSSNEVSLTQAIELERTLLEPLLDRATLRIDTSDINVHDLRSRIREWIAARPDDVLALQLRSFGFKYGVPGDADFVFDARCLPNPYWDPELRDLTGHDAPVQAFLAAAPAVAGFLRDVTHFLDTWVPRFADVNRSYLTIAIGCTGGRHRSVYLVERLAEHFRRAGLKAVTEHRDS